MSAKDSSNESVKQLFLNLMHADTEEDVVRILKQSGYWNDKKVWRYYGDNENNFSTIGNQQSRPDAAIVEKLINSVDHRLLNECFVRGIDPEGSLAPQSIIEAVANFFEAGHGVNSSIAGRIRNWSTSKRTEVARGITFVATGATAQTGNPSFTISDSGEGQTPEKMPETLVSLARSNKLRIPFVQGKFNMGGTGVLKFCGTHNLQLIVSRRNPEILSGKLEHTSDLQWSFTIVRREDPEGNRRSSVYTYLAPLRSNQRPREGGVLRFDAGSLPIFPNGREPYGKDSKHGTLIKLYEYRATGLKTNILRKDGMLSRIDLLLPDVALPIRFHECRPGYKGHAGSFETTLTGLCVRLDDDKAENLEIGFPTSCPMSVSGQQMTATIYAFKKGKADTYRKTEGIIFAVNGQTHGYLTLDFFRRKAVGLSYLADSILVIVDCTNLSGRAREDLFMNSRDRLSYAPLRYEIEDALEDLLKHHDGLKALRERRRSEEIESSLKDSKPLADILESIFKHSPTLSELFLLGKRLPNPFKALKAKAEEKPFQGRRFPTYFKFRGKDYGAELERDCHINMRCRVTFETDAVNDYFSRKVERGSFSLFILTDKTRVLVEDYTLNLQDGVASLNLRLPAEAQIGSTLRLSAEVKDPSRLESFENSFVVHVKEAVEPTSSKKGNRTKPPSEKPGEDRDFPAGIQLPNRIRVTESDWNKHDPPFDQYTALRIKHAGALNGDKEDSNDGKDVYDFFINLDNIHLKRYLKYELKSGQHEDVVQTRFEIGLMLVGLALIHRAAQQKNAPHAEGDEQEQEAFSVEDQANQVTGALAPFLLPMIDALGALESEELHVAHASGEAT
jgi:hypothetical protein